MPLASDTDGLPFLAGGLHERGDWLRHDAEAILRMQGDSHARLLVLDAPNEAGDGLHWTTLPTDGPTDGSNESPNEGELCFLGLDEGECPLFVALPGEDAAGPQPFDPSLWMLMGTLPRRDAGLFATARSLSLWHASHRFCSRCGTRTRNARGGWMRQCPSCEAQHFPRTDPVVIMLAEHDGRILLGRQTRFPERQYSVLAGFVEPGEGIEDAVKRELHEEAGIRAHGVRYIASQPWPFPSTLMIGCFAKCDDPALTLDENEIEHAFWADRSDVEAAIEERDEAKFILPPPVAIAHHLIRHWLDGAD